MRSSGPLPSPPPGRGGGSSPAPSRRCPLLPTLSSASSSTPPLAPAATQDLSTNQTRGKAAPPPRRQPVDPAPSPAVALKKARAGTRFCFLPIPSNAPKQTARNRRSPVALGDSRAGLEATPGPARGPPHPPPPFFFKPPLPSSSPLLPAFRAVWEAQALAGHPGASLRDLRLSREPYRLRRRRGRDGRPFALRWPAGGGETTPGGGA